MSQVLADLLVKLSADSAELKTEIGKGQDALRSFNHTAEEMNTSLKGILGLEVVRMFREGAEAIFEFVKGGAEAAEKLTIMSQKLGVSVSDMSRLSFAAKMVGSDGESLAGALSKLSKNIEDTSRGSGKASVAFEALGISVKGSDGTLRPSVDVMKDVADRFRDMEDGTNKTALAIMLFGKSGADMIPLLNRGSQGIAELEAESDRLGRTMSNEVAAAATEFEDGLKKLQGGASLFASTLAADLAPALNGMIDSFKRGAGSFSVTETGASALSYVIRLLGASAVVAEDGISSLFRRISYTGNEILSVAMGKFGAAGQLLDEWARKSVDAEEKYNDRMAALGFGTARVRPGPYKMDVYPPSQGVAEGWDQPDLSAGSDWSVAPGGVGAGKTKGPDLAALDAEKKAREDAIKAAEKAWEEARKAVQKYRTEVETIGMSDAAKKAFDLDHGALADTFAKAGSGAKNLKEELRGILQQLAAIADGKKYMDELLRLDAAADKYRAEASKKAGQTNYGQAAERLSTGDLSADFKDLARRDPMAAARKQDEILQSAGSADIAVAQQAIDAMAEKTAKLSLDTEQARTEYELAHGSLKKYVDEMGGPASAAGAQFTATMLAQADAFEAAQKHAAAIRAAKAEYEAARSPAQKYADTVKELEAALRGGALSQDQFDAGMKKARVDFEKSGGEMSAFSQVFAKNMEQAFADNLFKGWDKGLKGMYQAFIDTLKRMVAQAIAAKLLAAIGLGPDGGLLTKGLNAAGDFLGGGSGSSSYGPTPEVPNADTYMDGYAAGGYVPGTGPVIVGEKGPEIFVPSTSGHVVPNHELRGSSGASRRQAPQVLSVQVDQGHADMLLKDWLQLTLAKHLASRG